MAVKLESFEWPVPRPPRQGSKYPYDEWLSGDIWRLENGTDFDTLPKTMRAYLSHAGRARNLRAKTTILPNGDIVVKAFPRLEDKKRR